MGRVEVVRVSGRHDLEAFVGLPYALHRGDPCFTPPLRRDVRALLDPARNPFSRHAERGFASTAGAYRSAGWI